MASKSYWAKQKEKLSARGRLGASARWDRVHAAPVAVRESRVVEITIRDSHRPMELVRARREMDDVGIWGRWRVAGVAGRPVGPRGLGRLIALLIE